MTKRIIISLTLFLILCSNIMSITVERADNFEWTINTSIDTTGSDIIYTVNIKNNANSSIPIFCIRIKTFQNIINRYEAMV